MKYNFVVATTKLVNRTKVEALVRKLYLFSQSIKASKVPNMHIQNTQHAHPKMSYIMDLIHLRVGIYLNNSYWWTYIRYTYNT
jgi:hypothetical protein